MDSVFSNPSQIQIVWIDPSKLKPIKFSLMQPKLHTGPLSNLESWPKTELETVMTGLGMDPKSNSLIFELDLGLML